VESIASKVMEIKAKWFVRIEGAYEIGEPYIFDDFSRELREDDIADPETAPVEVLREAYATYFLPLSSDPFTSDAADEDTEVSQAFDKTLFHFLLVRMGKAGDGFASDHCLTLLGKHPEETRAICAYLERIERIGASDDAIVGFLESPDAIYPYQICQLVEWRLKDSALPTEEFLRIIRQAAFDDSRPYYLRSVCRKFLGEFGTSADVERLEHLYSNARDELEQCEILCSLKRMEKRRRNTFLGRYEMDSPLHQRAVAFVKASRAGQARGA